MSHHASGPDFGFPFGDARLDMTDLYAFPKPGEPGKSILILNVHPSVAVNPPGPTMPEPFAPGALYEFQVDTDGDAIADIAYNVQFRSTRWEQGGHFAVTGTLGAEVQQRRRHRRRAPVSPRGGAGESGDYRAFLLAQRSVL